MDLHDLNTRNDKKHDSWHDGWADGWEEEDYDEDMKPFWMCWVQGTSGAKFAHYIIDEACIESQRLARLPENKGKDVFLLECVGKCKVDLPPVRWDFPVGEPDEKRD